MDVKKFENGRTVYEYFMEPIYIYRVYDEGSQRKMKYRCSIVKKEKCMALYGRINLPDGNIDVNIAEYLLGVYYLKLEPIDIITPDNAPPVAREPFIAMIGTNRMSVVRAWRLLNAAQPSYDHISDILADAGYPLEAEFDAAMKSPIKQRAKKEHKIPGVLVNDRSTEIIRMVDLGDK